MQYKSVFISDIHLGTSDAKAENFLDFIKDLECENLFLVGDIIDGWAMKRKLTWLQSHSDVIQKVLRKARKGTKVFYVLGNHDEFIKPFLPLQLGDNITVVQDYSYIGVDKRKYLVTHGDIFDTITLTKKWLALLGDSAYMFVLRVNKPLNKLRKLIGYHKYWSLSKYLKQNVKKSMMFICEFEEIMVNYAKEYQYDGVICGHIHCAEIKDIQGVTYLNCGDWVESCTALVEDLDGDWKILEHLVINE
ncbi:UDP-2,3-diacylglucosamine diphosphatase [Arcobacter sp. FWKO B]|uniref:UDP-2,3-diacylglucosamine diphosphatase n=1 Tax=Arcobacter sp. FWKO B TaxID=2593672 RepID=UPI0018A48CF7|nr:UDP-2,3-diacylglucosamine diphosphatase [Arcobacter sp. FWKO B]QOG12353.1 UDP-2,3-diacylglucosamine diphosphatase [Arcobacter sp. FWKO B]